MLSAFKMELDWHLGWPTWWSMVLTSWQPLGLFCLVAILMMSLIGLLAVWAGVGRGHWFVRVAVVLGCISLLLTIPAYELVVVYLVQTGATIGVLALRRRWRVTPDAAADGRGRWQFSILDLLLLMVIVAWLSAVLTRVPAAVWHETLVLLAEGLVTAALTIAAAAIGLSNLRWRWRVPLLVVLFPTASMVVWLWLWRETFRSKVTSPSEVRLLRISQAVFVAVSVAMAAPVVGICWRLAHPRTYWESHRWGPNGYIDLVQAGRSISGANVPNLDTATLAQLKTFVAQCRPAYAPAQGALRGPCWVPLRVNLEDLDKSISDVQALRELSRAFYARGRVAAAEGRNWEAILLHTDTIRLGRAAMQNGLFVDMFLGATNQRIGRDGIVRMRKALSAEECVALLRTLCDMSDGPAVSADMLARDAAWQDNAYGWQGRLAVVIDELAPTPWSDNCVVERCSNIDLTQSRLLLCELAIRAYSLEHGRNPAILADLVPEYLPKVPKDPFDGGDFVYRRTSKGYQLHSRHVGPQGKPITADDRG